MKKSIYTAFLACTLASAAPIQAQQTDKEAQKARTEQTVKEALEARRYRIEVNYMTPMRGRSRALTDNYSLTIHGDSVLSYLPYVGEAYSAPYGGGKGLNFDALIQTYEAKEGKKGRKEIRFTTTNDEDSYTYHLTIYPDGTTQIRIQPTRRQSISFNGKMDTGVILFSPSEVRCTSPVFVFLLIYNSLLKTDVHRTFLYSLPIPANFVAKKINA